MGRPGECLRLRNGWYLRLLLTFRVEPSVSAGGANKLKTISSSIQYQQFTTEQESWVFRYEYLRHANNHYAPGHLHVRWQPDESDRLPNGARLSEIHFPTGRVGLEAIIRLLIDDFRVGANEPEEVWRRLLFDTEQEFMHIMRQPQPRRDR